MGTLLSLDLGTTTGWAISHQGTITSGTAHFNNDRYSGGGMRFLRFRKWLDEMQTLHHAIDEVYFEEVRRHGGTDAAHVYGGLMGILTAWCEQEKIPYEGVPVGTIKKFATGKGNSSKGEMRTAMEKKGHHPTDHNEADALALLYWKLEQEEDNP